MARHTALGLVDFCIALDVCARRDTAAVFLGLATVSGGGASTATIVAIAAAFTAPVVTGLFLLRNTGRTLRAERERLDATLAAEDKRLAERLAFERAQTDRGELREILDAIAGELSTLNQLSREVWEYAHARYSALQAGSLNEYDAAHREANEALDDSLHAAAEVASDHIERLHLRLGHEAQDLLQGADRAHHHARHMPFRASQAINVEGMQFINGEVRLISEFRHSYMAQALKLARARLDAGT
jgi:hypothetical protein